MKKLGIGLSGLAALAFVVASTSTPVFANEQNGAMESSFVLAQDDGAGMVDDSAAMNEGAAEASETASEATPAPAPAKKAGKASKRGGKHGKMGKKKKAGKKG